MASIKEFYSVIQAHSLHHARMQKSYVWTMSSLTPFDELLISWNADRPLRGHYVILSRVLIRNQWSPWLLYAVWGSHHQYSFEDKTSEAPVHSFQDQVEILEGEVATGFSIRIEACDGAALDNFYDLYACPSRLQSFHSLYPPQSLSSFALPVPTISQLCLTHPRSHSLCSPTSTTAVLQYHLNQQLPVQQFAKRVYDAGFDIYGNWAFNIAQAFVELGPQWQCFHTRLANLELLWYSLQLGLPVVISIKGSLPGAFLPYSSGHLIVIKGYDAAAQKFLCMDPAFPSDQQTEVAYPWQVLMQAWKNRRFLTYFFLPRKKPI